MIAIIDYGMGNLRSVQKAFEKVGAKAQITQNKKEIERAQKVVLPGVGAMKPAMKKLQQLDLIPIILDAARSNKPFLGICLGLQLLFEESDEGGSVKGLRLLDGTVKRFVDLKIPHMGWNQIKIKNADCPILKGINDNVYTYFCHSYYVTTPNESIISTTTQYGLCFASSVWKKNIYGLQFHPEKSQVHGLKILKNFVELNE